MLCNILSLVIFLLIVIIISIIIFKQSYSEVNNKNNKQDIIEKFNPAITNTTILPPDTIPSEYTARDAIKIAEVITNNNNRINNLLEDINNKSPEVKINNYNSQNVYKEYENQLINKMDILGNALNNNITMTTLDRQQQIDLLEQNINDMETIVRNMGLSKIQNTYYNRIKSLNNGLEIGLIRTPNTVYTNERTGSNSGAYMVSMNDGCLSVGANEYGVYKCDDKNPKQFFKMEHILNPTAYGANIDSSLPINTSSNLSTLNYPFVMMKSVNNENCLTNTHGSVTVQPCYTFEAQRWFPLQ